jgi:hypothetical protein
MAVTRCTLSTVLGRLIAAVNAAPAATWATTVSSADDQRHNTTELTNIVLAADARICQARAKRRGDGYRSLFLSLSASITHGSELPDSLGTPEMILIKYISADSEYKPGIYDPSLSVADINRWRANADSRYGAAHDASGSILSGYFQLISRQLFYTGADAKAQIATFTRSGACQAPETDEDMLLGLSLGDALKEGDIGTPLATIIGDARTEYADLLKVTPAPWELALAA